MATNTTLSCPAPFLSESDYPGSGGFQAGRFCGQVVAGLSCCLPCPVAQWVFSDDFYHKLEIAYWFNVPSLVCQVFLLLTYAVLPVEKSHRHYLSAGLCVSMIMVEVSREHVSRKTPDRSGLD